MLVNLCVKNQDTSVNYKLNSFKVNEDTITLDNVNFHIPTLIKEVENAPKSKVKKYMKITQAFIVTATAFLLPLRSMANSSIPAIATNLPKTAEGVPPELLALLIKLLVIAVAISIMLAGLLLMAAGVMKMFRKRKEANEWTSDILKGLVQILVSVPVVFLIYYVATLLFSGQGWFVSPF